jgi:signal peptidase II
LLVVILDQIVKLTVHHNMDLNSEIMVFGDWFRIHYILNNGMAFGLKLDWEYGKLLLTTFRLVAMFGIGYYLIYLVKKGVPQGLLWSVALILGGAIGNLVDSIFYGALLNNAPLDAITPWFHGQVIDMLYFPIFQGYLPDWVPLWGGDYFEFFRPIFNLADSSIFIGVVIILIGQKKFFAENTLEETTTSTENEESSEDSASL